MGLDIYAGTLTRYYSHNWKTVVQQWAEENGYSFNRITPDGEPADDEELSPTNVQAAVENWRDQILAAISQPDQPPYAPWPEDNEKPYYTDKPDWDAFGAMLLVAACRTYEEPVPPTVEKDWIFGEHPLIARLASDEERVWSLFRGVTWWLPLTDSFLFQGPLPTDDTVAIATLGGLRKELEKLNQLAWQADEDTILGWADTEGYPVDGTVDSDGQYSKARHPRTPSMTPNPLPSSPSPCSGGPCGLPRNSRCPSCLIIKEDSSGGGDRGTKTPGRYISGGPGLLVERLGPGGKGLEAAEKRRLQKENEKRADLSDLV